MCSRSRTPEGDFVKFHCARNNPDTDRQSVILLKQNPYEIDKAILEPNIQRLERKPLSPSDFKRE